MNFASHIEKLGPEVGTRSKKYSSICLEPAGMMGVFSLESRGIVRVVDE